MKIQTLAAFMIVGLSSVCRADCGTQAYVIGGNRIPLKVIRRAVGVVEFSGEPTESLENLHIYHDRQGRIEDWLTPAQSGPVSTMPKCREKKGFDGNTFLVTEIWEGSVRFVADWSTGREVWYRPGGGPYQLRLWSFTQPGEKLPELVDIFFRHDKVKVYSAPDTGSRLLILETAPVEWPRQRSVYEVMSYHDGFIQISDAGKPVGWIRVRDEDDALAVWPAYRDADDARKWATVP